ncbi:transaldolase [Aequoribacter sp.]|jgi:transaldolase|uniref:transaldolase n=1 Tax=Aequoribacter sp. TaxID=2847771 RepID=UPI003F69F0A2
MNKLEQLKSMTTVVADTGDIRSIAQYQPQDATTNPSLLLKAAQDDHFRPFLDQALAQAQQNTRDSDAQRITRAADEFAVLMGAEIAKLVPGVVSTEVDARLSFSTPETVNKALSLVEAYDRLGLGTDRILIKIAATWEGIQAAKILEAQGIHCNLTLLFGFGQAQACADAGVFLISPFVGRILDWYKQNTNIEIIDPLDDPGVQSVTRIFNYYKTHGYRTVVMGASFRNQGQIEALAGCDRLTISPDLLASLQDDSGALTRKLDAAGAASDTPKQAPFEASFRYDLNADAMATDKLSDGIRRFIADQEKLEQLIKSC